MVFAEPDRTSLAPLSAEILRDLGTRIDLAGFPKEALDTDLALAATLAGGPFVLGYQFEIDNSTRGKGCVLHPPSARRFATPKEREASTPSSMPVGSSATCPACRRRPDPPDFSTSPPTRTASCAAFPW